MLSNVGAAMLTAVMLGGLFSVDGNGKVKTEERSVAAFTGISLGGGLRAEVRTGDAQSVTLTTDENLLPLVETEVKGGVLHVRLKRSVDPTDELRLSVVVPKVHYLSASGGVTLDAELSRSEALKVEGSGGSELDIRGIESKVVVVELSGGVEAHLSGRAERARYELSGGVVVKAVELRVKEANVEASGGVDARVHASERIDGRASGGVSVRVAGSPKLALKLSPGASVVAD